MPTTSVLLAFILFAQAPAPAAKPGPSRTTPPEMIARAMDLPAGAKLSGRGLSLLDVLTPIRDGRRQLEVTHAYWRLAAGVVEYNLSNGELESLVQFQVQVEDEAVLRTARSAAAASLQEAELAVVAAQHKLAEAALLPPDDPFPLPTDRPHVGPYETRFERIFSCRVASPQARLIHHTLPIRRRAIDARATAVHAAEDALSAAEDLYQSGQANLETVLGCMARLSRQRRALVASVCNYNHEIAEYALSVVGRPTSGEALVAMLIKPGQNARTPAPKRISTTADPSRGPQPTLAPPRTPLRRLGNTEPTLAPRMIPVYPAEKSQPSSDTPKPK